MNIEKLGLTIFTILLLLVAFLSLYLFQYQEQNNLIVNYALALITSVLATLAAFLGSFFIIGKMASSLHSSTAARRALVGDDQQFGFKGGDEFDKLAYCLDKMRNNIVLLLKNKDDLIDETIVQKEEIQSLYQQMVALNDDLTQALSEKNAAYIATIKALADAVEAKDYYTRGHSDRVLKYAVAMGEAMRMDQEQLDLLSYAAILHDIGKIGVPSGILNKSGQLTVEEYEIIKRHPLTGYKIINNIDYLKDVSKAVVQHHEWLNGNGYPSGLCGEEISMHARIIAIADAYDAMTSIRPYRRQLSWQDACAELQSCQGIQFDENMVAVFCGLVASQPEKFMPQE